MASELTQKQIDFAHYLVSGLTLTEAYRRTHRVGERKTTTANTAPWDNASRLAKHPAVAAYIAQLRKESKAAATADRAEKLRLLEAQMRDPDLAPRDRQAAIKLHNEMTGDNAPIKHEVSISTDLVALATAAAQ